MTEPNPATVADRLAAAGVRVKPLVWRRFTPSEHDGSLFSGRSIHDYVIEKPKSGEWIATTGEWETPRDIHVVIARGTKAECIAACEAHHAAAVLALLEVVPSEEPKL